jgi:hypothetical protein
VFCQYPQLEFPTAFTIDATHDGPPPVLIAGWSEFWPVGVTQETLASLQPLISVNTWAGWKTTFDHAVPVHWSFPFTVAALQSELTEFGADQII